MSEAHMNDSENAELRRAYAATARDEPSPALDDAILAKSRSAILTDPRSAILTRHPLGSLFGTPASSRHWSQLLAVAATLVVTASLVLLMQQEIPQIAGLAAPARDTAVTPVAKIPTEAVQATQVAPSELSPREYKPRSSGRVDVPARDQPPEQTSQEREQPVIASPQLADARNLPFPRLIGRRFLGLDLR